MQFVKQNASEFLPQGEKKKITHMCIAAHFDDVEFMAYHGVLECFGKDDKWFSAVVVTDGAGSPRSGLYGDYSDVSLSIICGYILLQTLPPNVNSPVYFGLTMYLSKVFPTIFLPRTR